MLNLSDPNDPNSGPTATDGRLFGVSVETPGVDPANASTDPDFRSGADGTLLAQVDFDVVGGGTTDFDFILGGLGVFNDGIEQVAVGFESASLTVLGEPVDLPPVQPPVDPPTPPPVDPPTPPPVDPVDPPTPPPVGQPTPPVDLPVDPPVEPAPQGDPDFFFSFDQNSRVLNASGGPGDATGSVFIFADEDVDFNQLDLDFTNNDSSVISFTGGVVFNDGALLSGAADSAPGGSFTSFALLDPEGLASGVTSTDGRLFATSFLSPGQVPGSEASNFIPEADGFLLARIDFDIIGEGIVDLDFINGDLGIVNDGVGAVESTFGSATFSFGSLESAAEPAPPAIPEPSSAILLILGAAGMAARRRRS